MQTNINYNIRQDGAQILPAFLPDNEFIEILTTVATPMGGKGAVLRRAKWQLRRFEDNHWYGGPAVSGLNI
jgi:hypothetical protein